jgi:hypothetical protein
MFLRNVGPYGLTSQNSIKNIKNMYLLLVGCVSGSRIYYMSVVTIFALTSHYSYMFSYNTTVVTRSPITMVV